MAHVSATMALTPKITVTSKILPAFQREMDQWGNENWQYDHLLSKYLNKLRKTKFFMLQM